MTDDLAALAAGLTKGQREVLLSDSLNYMDPNTARALRRKGLMHEHRATATERGLALRAHLKDNPK